MRALLTPVALAAALAACAPSASLPRSNPVPDMPLRAWIQPRDVGFGIRGNLQFYVNRPAYVAIFEMIPGRGIGLMHPSMGSDGARRQSYAGWNRTWTGLGSFRWAYSPFSPAYDYYGSAYTYSRPRYYFLVASDEPLRIEDFVESPTALRSAFGTARFAAYDPYDLMEDLTRMIVPLQPAGNWTTDVYVEWPEPRPLLRTAQVDYRIVRCDDGSRIVVPLRSSISSCPSDAQIDGEPSDSGKVQKPVRRRPEPGGPKPAEVVRTGLDTSPRARPEPARIRPVEPESRPAEPDRKPAIRDRERIRPTPVTTPHATRAEPRAEPPPPRADRPSPRAERPQRASPRAEPPRRSSPRMERTRSAPPPRPRPAPRPSRPSRDRSSDEPATR